MGRRRERHIERATTAATSTEHKDRDKAKDRNTVGEPARKENERKQVGKYELVLWLPVA